ncbi:transcription factor JunB [Bombina bombina]|uniref:transcription factor JunB n=1 Tax=Bombina bombina TaxID=8345 RepID=UPI00235AFB95|nr:transcription factor JunB [Bombina bombina]
MCSKMEQPFYHDDSLLSAYSRTDPGLLKTHMGSITDAYRLSKHDMPYYTHQDSATATSHHTTPASLKMAGPELERLIIHSGPGVSCPSGGQLYYAPRGGGGNGITEEQEGFVDGFVKALDDLHKMNREGPPNVSLRGGSVPMSGGSNSPGGNIYGDTAVYANLASYHPSCYRQPSATINYLPQSHSGYGASSFKEEPQTVPESSDSRDGTPTPLSPINMEDQERIKVERKRLRNRLAATKCRKRKLERIARLEEKVRDLKNENSGLSGTAGALREQVEQLKGRVREHARHGCQLLLGPKGHQVF